jgi:serine/threonine protein phosphatase PrpC
MSSIRARSSSLGGESVSVGAKKSRRSKESSTTAADDTTMVVVGEGGDEIRVLKVELGSDPRVRCSVGVRGTAAYGAVKGAVCRLLKVSGNQRAMDIVVVDAVDGLVLGELSSSALTPHQTDVQLALEGLDVKYVLRSLVSPLPTSATSSTSANKLRSPRSRDRGHHGHSQSSPRSPRAERLRSPRSTPDGTVSPRGSRSPRTPRSARGRTPRHHHQQQHTPTAAAAAGAAAAPRLAFSLDEMMTPEELAAYDAAHADEPIVRTRSDAFYDNKAAPASAGHAAAAASTADKLPDKSSSGRGTRYSDKMSSEGVSEEVLSSTDPELLRVGFAHTIGRRATMEDAISIVGRFADDPTRAFFAVFDGHNGHACAQLGARHLHTLVREHFEDEPPKVSLRGAHSQISTMMSDAQLQGGACVVSVFCVDELLFVANCGDCRCVAVRGSKVTRVTRDHTPSLPDEQRRIERLGGRIDTQVMPDGKVVARVQGRLGVSRALGDGELHPFVTAEPDIFGPFSVQRDFELCILACDGVWDVITDADAAAIVRPLRHDPERAAIALRDAAFRGGSLDNISVVVVVFPPGLAQTRQRSRTVVQVGAADQSSDSDSFHDLPLFDGAERHTRRSRRSQKHRHRRQK